MSKVKTIDASALIARNFGVFLSQVEDGELNAELGRELAMVNEKLAELAVDGDCKVKGELSVKLSITHDERGTVEVVGIVSTKLPKRKRGRSIFWVGPGGVLETSNPKQTKLPLRDVGGRQEVKELAEEISAPKEVI